MNAPQTPAAPGFPKITRAPFSWRKHVRYILVALVAAIGTAVLILLQIPRLFPKSKPAAGADQQITVAQNAGRLKVPGPDQGKADASPAQSGGLQEPGKGGEKIVPGIVITPDAGRAQGQAQAAPPVDSRYEGTLRGAAVRREAPAAAPAGAAPLDQDAPRSPGLDAEPARSAAGVPRASTDLGARLVPSSMPMARATYLPDSARWLTRGTPLKCTMPTPIDTGTGSAMVLCEVSKPAYGSAPNERGKLEVLVNRGAMLVGEVGPLAQGADAAFALFSSVRDLVDGRLVTYEIASPAGDALGRNGIGPGSAGELQRHFWRRFGIGTLLALIPTISANISLGGGGSGAPNVYLPPVGGAARTATQEVLSHTMQQPPTLRTCPKQAQACPSVEITVLVVRDVYIPRPEAVQ